MRGRIRALAAALLVAVAGCATVRPAAEQPFASEASRLAGYQALSAYGAAQPRTIDAAAVTYTGDAGHLATSSVVHLVFDDTVFFDSGSDVPLPASQSVLDVLAKNLRRDGSATQLTVVGHTDAVGGDDYNLGLSRRRATSVIAALAGRGIAHSELSAVAMGKNQPVAPNDTESGRAQNRRVEFFISPDVRANAAAIGATPETMALLGPGAAPAASVSLFRLGPDTGSVAIPLTVVAAQMPPPAAVAQQPIAAPPPRAAAPRPRPTTPPVSRIRPVTPGPPENLKPVIPDSVAPAPLGPPQTF